MTEFLFLIFQKKHVIKNEDIFGIKSEEKCELSLHSLMTKWIYLLYYKFMYYVWESHLTLSDPKCRIVRARGMKKEKKK
jgi:hypothetical protein